MTGQDLQDILEQTSLPADHHHFAKGRALPVLVWYRAGYDEVAADGRVYYRSPVYVIELYTEDEGEQQQERVERALDNAGVYYSKDGPEFIPSERFWMTTYANIG